MRAARLFVLLSTLGLFGIVPSRLEPSSPAFNFVALAQAGPLQVQQPGTDASQQARSAAVGHQLPAFVPNHQTLTFSGEGESEPEAEAAARPQAPLAAAIMAASDGALAGSLPTVSALPAAALGAVAAGTLATSVAVKPTVDPAEPDAAPAASAQVATTAPDAKPAAPDGVPKIIGAKTLFGAVKEPAPLAARAIGYYARGCLSGAVALPIDGPAWQEMRLSRNRNWGHPKLIKLIERFAKDAQKLDGWPGLLIGDIAQPRGGPMLTGHASHQIGLDADIWLTPMPNRRLSAQEREDIQATSMLDATGVAVDPKVFTGKQVALIKRAASYPEVERIFVHPAIKKALCQAAGTDRAWLGKVRPYYGHYYHFHVRIKCPPGFAGCTPQVPPTGGDGCGKEVDQWLARVIPRKEPPAPTPPNAKPKPPKPPVMLSELPNECRAVLAAKPDPVAIPRAALMKPAEVRQVLAKAAAARATLAKAETASGDGHATTGASGVAATSPALRPYMRKTIAAEKK